MKMENTDMKTRFAPSPTGLLHIGNIRTALICYLYAKKSRGELLLRIDDTDTQRSKAEYADKIQEDLKWLGLNWDEIAFQSKRFDKYDAAVEKLKADGRLYACYESAEELDVKRKMQLSRGLPPIYDRAGLKLTADEIAKFEAEGKTPHWRFKMADGAIAWEDEVRGSTKFETKNLSDPILIRENGAYTYMLPSTVDDIEFEITHVLRGEDHVSNTAIQIQLFEALGGDVPKFAHTAMVKSKEGKLSKRTGSAGVGELCDDKILPMAVNSFLAKVGTSDSIELRPTLDDLVAEFDINKFGRAPTIYTIDDILRLNVKALHELSFEDAKPYFAGLKLTDVKHDFWLAVRPNLENIDELYEWWTICNGSVKPIIDDADFAAKAAELLPDGEWDETTWKSWADAVKEKTGRKGKELFMPLRKAITGMEHGPELKVLLPLIGREKVLERLGRA